MKVITAHLNIKIIVISAVLLIVFAACIPTLVNYKLKQKTDVSETPANIKTETTFEETTEKTMKDKEFEKAVEKEWLKTSAYIELRKESGKDFISSKIMGEQAAIFALLGKVMEVLLERINFVGVLQVFNFTKSTHIKINYKDLHNEKYNKKSRRHLCRICCWTSN